MAFAFAIGGLFIGWSSSEAQAANRFLVLNDAGCTVTAIATDLDCWASTSGGAGGAGVPGSADTAILDANSGTGTGTMSAAMDVLGWCSNNSCSGTGNFAGTISTGNFALTVGAGGYTQAGTFQPGSSTVTVSGSVNIATGTFAGANSNWVVSGTAIWTGGINVSVGSLSLIGGGTVTFSGNATHIYGLFDLGTSTVSGSGVVNLMAPNGTISTSGTFSSTAVLGYRDGTMPVVGRDYGVLWIRNAYASDATFTAAGDITAVQVVVFGTATATGAAVFDLNNHNLAITGTASNSLRLQNDHATTTRALLAGTGAVSVAGGVSIENQNSYITSSPSGSWTVGGAWSNSNTNASWDFQAPITFTSATGGTMTFAGTNLDETEFGNATFASSAATAQTFTMSTRGLRIGGTLTVSDSSSTTALNTSASNLPVTAGAIIIGSGGILTANASIVTVGGNYTTTNANTTSWSSGSGLVFAGPATIATKNNENIQNMTINDGVTVTVSSGNPIISVLLTIGGASPSTFTLIGNLYFFRSAAGGNPIVIGSGVTLAGTGWLIWNGNTNQFIPGYNYGPLNLSAFSNATSTTKTQAGNVLTTGQCRVYDNAAGRITTWDTAGFALSCGTLYVGSSGLAGSTAVLNSGSSSVSVSGLVDVGSITPSSYFISSAGGSWSVGGTWTNNSTSASWDHQAPTTFTSATGGTMTFAGDNLPGNEFNDVAFESPTATPQTFTMSTRGLKLGGTLTISDASSTTTLNTSVSDLPITADSISVGSGGILEVNGSDVEFADLTVNALSLLSIASFAPIDFSFSTNSGTILMKGTDWFATDLTSPVNVSWGFNPGIAGATVTVSYGGLPPSTKLTLFRDGTQVQIVTSSPSGLATFTIAGGWGGYRMMRIGDLGDPSSFTGTALSTTSIRWTWVDNSTEDGFRIYSGTGSLIATLGANVDLYDETGLSPDTSYIRYVKAFKGAAESSASNSATVKTKALPPPALPAEEETPPIEEEKEEPPAGEEIPPEEVLPPAPSFWEKLFLQINILKENVIGWVSITTTLLTDRVRSGYLRFSILWGSLIESSKDTLSYLRDQAETTFKEVLQLAQTAAENLSSGVGGITVYVGRLAQDLMSGAESMARSMFLQAVYVWQRVDYFVRSAQTDITQIVQVIADKSSDSLQVISGSFGNVAKVVSDFYNQLARGASATAESLLSIARGGISTATAVIQNTGLVTARIAQSYLNDVREGISRMAFKVGDKVQDVSDVVGFAIVKFGYLFVGEPTTIFNVQVATISQTSVRISWETNHPATGKVNYGLDRTYPFDIQSDNRATFHEFTLTNLQPGTLYYFEVMSQNKNYIYDANREFRTPIK